MELSTDWREQRRRILEKAKRVIIKIGSAVLTTEKGIDPRVVNRLADQIAGRAPAIDTAGYGIERYR